MTGFGLEPALETNPASATAGPVVAVSVSAFVHDSFQIAVFRSCVNRAPGADVISCGTVSAKLTVKTDASWSAVSSSWVPGDGDGCAVGWVLNVQTSDWPEGVWLAEANKPAVCARLMFGFDPDFA